MIKQDSTIITITTKKLYQGIPKLTMESYLQYQKKVKRLAHNVDISFKIKVYNISNINNKTIHIRRTSSQARKHKVVSYIYCHRKWQGNGENPLPAHQTFTLWRKDRKLPVGSKQSQTRQVNIRLIIQWEKLIKHNEDKINKQQQQQQYIKDKEHREKEIQGNI